MTDTKEAAAMTSDVADLTCSELQDQLNDLGRELEHRNNKKQKYKQCYLDEKEKNAFLQRHYFDELKVKDDELAKLKEQIQDTSEDYSLRVAKLQVQINSIKCLPYISMRIFLTIPVAKLQVQINSIKCLLYISMRIFLTTPVMLWLRYEYNYIFHINMLLCVCRA